MLDITSIFMNIIHKPSFKSGIQHSYPICIAFSLMYAALGMMGHAKGISLGKMVAMSATIFAVPLQALVINNQELTVLTTIINAFILNFKFLLMSAVLIPLWKRKFLTIPSLHFICNSTYMVCAVEEQAQEPWSFYLGVSIPSYIIAILATFLGYGLWEIGSDFQSFLHALAHIVLPIHFVCLTLKRKKDKFIVFTTLLGFVATPFLISLIGAKVTVLAWLLCASVIVLIEERICGKQLLQPA